ncbi:MAG: DnaJ domain-containing protein [Tissierellia bacterium]|nr:DnaJ domain-containing protein [Tissierellia bacterium]MDD4779055.1 DnaJ domain-containing protein [Tissierellia bacterium]
MDANTAFKILEIKKKFPISEEIIKKKYREKAKENHPDICGNDTKMKKINEAYDWLSKNLDNVNQANVKNTDTKTQNNYNHFKQLDEVISYFLKWYPMQFDIDKRKVMVDTLLKAVDMYKLEEKMNQIKSYK